LSCARPTRPSPPAASDLRAELAPSLAAVRDDWRALEAGLGPFATWDWADAWWRAFGADKPLRVAVVSERGSGDVVAIVPLYLDVRAPLRMLRFVGRGPADECGPVGPRELAGPAFEAALARLGGGWDVVLADHVDAGGPIAAAGRVLKTEPSPVLDLPDDGFDGFLRARSRNFREQVRRRERKLAREHDVVFRLCADPARLEADMATLFRLHSARWGDEQSAAFEERRRAFHLDVARAALAAGWLRLWHLEVDGAPVAAWYGFRRAGEELYYQSGRDPGWEDRSVGFVLLAHTIRAASDDGVRTYRLLRGGEPYKDRFATRDEPVATVAMGRGVRGSSATATAAWLAAIDPERRRRVLAVMRRASRSLR
jgi:CelD/BcsL family acetyltransferase involved in cellulose biosynthesis